MNGFLPINRQEMQDRGWYYCDFLLVTGDAYVDHPSFGTAIISRVLEDAGYKVAILSQPDFRDERDFAAMGRPRYAVLINGGNIDSMVAHYTAAKKRRSDDAYTPGGQAGKRPDRAVTVYAMLARRAFPDVPVYLGGIEASLRRFAHYDYWADRVMPSILESTGADGLMFGMSEHAVIQLANNLKHGKKGADACVGVRGTAYMAHDAADIENAVECPSYEDVCADKAAYARAVKLQYDEQDHVRGRALLQRHGRRVLIQNPPALPLTTAEMDHVYALPYMRTYHPSYEALGGVPAIQEVQFSIIHNRGCFGACNFCALAFHQGRYIQARSHESVLAEARQIVRMPGFKGYIHDVGGPTANFRFPSCKQQEQHGLCKNKRCLFPSACQNLEADHTDYLNLLRELRQLEGVKKVFVRSGLRYDYMMADRNDAFFRELVEHHISGQLKVAPEHMSDNALYYMGKPSFSVYEQFPRAVRPHQPEAGPQAVSGSLPDELAPRRDAGRRDPARGVPQQGRLHAGTGAGLLSHPGHALDRDVLHRDRPAHNEAGLCGQNRRGKGHAARAFAVAAAGQAADRAGGAQKGRAGGSDRATERNA